MYLGYQVHVLLVLHGKSVPEGGGVYKNVKIRPLSL